MSFTIGTENEKYHGKQPETAASILKQYTATYCFKNPNPISLSTAQDEETTLSKKFLQDRSQRSP